MMIDSGIRITSNGQLNDYNIMEIVTYTGGDSDKVIMNINIVIRTQQYY